MPLYSFNCKTCKEVKDISLPMEERNNKIKCEGCKKPLQRVITSFSLAGMDNLGRSK